jgi:glycosyltransferase involved in cell wall biosynthesis
MSYGLPVVCFDLGGPGVLVNETCGIVVPTAGKSRGQLIVDLAEAMKILADETDRSRALQAGALARTREFTWTSVVKQVYGEGGLLEQIERPGRPR